MLTILPDALPGGRQNALCGCPRSRPILPDALPGGRQNVGVFEYGQSKFYPMHFRGKAKPRRCHSSISVYFTRCTSGGKAKHFTPGTLHFRDFTRCTSGGKAKQPLRLDVDAVEFYPMHFRGEGKTHLVLIADCRDFTRCTSGGKAKPARRFAQASAQHFTRCTSGGKAKLW